MIAAQGNNAQEVIADSICQSPSGARPGYWDAAADSAVNLCVSELHAGILYCVFTLLELLGFAVLMLRTGRAVYYKEIF